MVGSAIVRSLADKGYINILSRSHANLDLIAELAPLVSDVICYPSAITSDPNKPDGAPRKLRDVSKLHRPQLEIDDPFEGWNSEGLQ